MRYPVVPLMREGRIQEREEEGEEKLISRRLEKRVASSGNKGTRKKN